MRGAARPAGSTGAAGSGRARARQAKEPAAAPELGVRLAPEGGPLAVDVGRLNGTHLAIQGNSGAGKSRTIRKLLELTHGGPQHIVLDVEDEFYTLRQRFPYLIAGGEAGDCPATVGNAAELARALLETGVSAVVQINDLPLDARRAFVRRFLEAMVGAPRSLWHPTLVVLDEADRYAPQEGVVESLGAVVALMAQGRKRGFTGVLATQRLAKIAKDCTGDVNNWLMGRVGQSADRRAVADALGFRPSGEQARGLIGLEPGSFWAFGPALSPEPVLIRVGPVVTTHLRGGEGRVPTPPAPRAMRALLERLRRSSEAVPDAPAEGDRALRAGRAGLSPVRDGELEELRGRVRRLEEELGLARAVEAQARDDLLEARAKLAQVATIVGGAEAPAPPVQDRGHEEERPAAAARSRRTGKRRRAKATPRTLARARRLLADPTRTVEEVARRVGIGTATLYRHLPGGRRGLSGRP